MAELTFQQVYDTYQPRILRFLMRLVGPEEAEDLSQEVFLRAHRNLATFRGDSQLSTWLYRIASNLAIDRMRSASSRNEKAQAPLQENCEAPQGEPSFEQVLLKKDRYHCFLGYVQHLPMNYRAILLLHEIGELTTAEIACKLGLSQETVKIRLHRGRTRLFQALRQSCRPEEWI